MQISKNSWHYRFNAWMQESFVSRSKHEIFTTCSYIRTTIFSMIVGFLKGVALTAASIIALGVLVGTAYLPFYLVGLCPAIEILKGLGGIGWGLIALVLICLLVNYLSPYFRARKARKIALLQQAMLDKKAGICTIIEYV